MNPQDLPLTNVTYVRNAKIELNAGFSIFRDVNVTGHRMEVAHTYAPIIWHTGYTSDGHYVNSTDLWVWSLLPGAYIPSDWMHECHYGRGKWHTSY